ncbi:hypothetical protein G6F44_013375 [Rhizopus delemar]|nr:hypothetical protein G6F44_013375 [Rhizopus delemar]
MILSIHFLGMAWNMYGVTQQHFCSCLFWHSAHVPPDHWLRSPRRSKLQAHQFFTFDSVRRCIRPLLAPDGPPFPRLSSWLTRDLQRRIISLNDLTWSLILHETTDVGTVDDTPFVSWFTRSSYWYLFDSKVFRLNQLSSLLPLSFSTWSSQKWRQFWSLKIAPEARSLWYRFLYNKLHCQTAIKNGLSGRQFCHNLLLTLSSNKTTFTQF